MANLMERAELQFNMGIKLLEIKNRPDIYPIMTVWLQTQRLIAQVTPNLVDLINQLLYLFDSRLIYNYQNINNPIVNIIESIDFSRIDDINFANQLINLRITA